MKPSEQEQERKGGRCPIFYPYRVTSCKDSETWTPTSPYFIDSPVKQPDIDGYERQISQLQERLEAWRELAKSYEDSPKVPIDCTRQRRRNAEKRLKELGEI